MPLPNRVIYAPALEAKRRKLLCYNVREGGGLELPLVHPSVSPRLHNAKFASSTSPLLGLRSDSDGRQISDSTTPEAVKGNRVARLFSVNATSYSCYWTTSVAQNIEYRFHKTRKYAGAKIAYTIFANFREVRTDLVSNANNIRSLMALIMTQRHKNSQHTGN